jgi:uncharacterized membrane protein YccC
LINLERIIHSLKTGFACLIGFAITKLLHPYLSFDQWLIITILVVMCAQISVGSVVYKSSLRFIGTCLGSLAAAFTIMAFGNNPLALAGVIALAGIVFSYIATSESRYSDAGTLGAVTTALILINPHPTLLLTVERFFEISIGIIIATLVSQFILPIHARKHLARNQAQTLYLLGEYYSKAVAPIPEEKDKLIELDEKIVRLLIMQRKLAQEARRELLGSKFEPNQFKLLLEGEKRILRSVDFLSHIYQEPIEHYSLHNNSEWLSFNNKIAGIFTQLGKNIENPKKTFDLIEVPNLNPLKIEIAKIIDIQPQEQKKNTRASRRFRKY